MTVPHNRQMQPPVTAPLTLTPPPSPRQHLTTKVKSLAAEHGLTIASVTSAESFDGLAETLERHIAAGHLDGLDWFTPERARFSASPRNLHPSARSILAVGVAYWSVDPGKPEDTVLRGRIARYAWGVDYHVLLKARMRSFLAALEQEVGGPVESRALVDTARIVDRAVAARAGLGWYGKHSCLIVPGHGSWVMLGEVLLDLDLEPDRPLDRDCGRCSISLDRCPTGAIVAPYTVSTPRCLSFQTIEQRGAIPREIRPLLGDWVFGCDVCQDVCPYTKAALPEPDPAFLPKTVDNAYPSLHRLLKMTDVEFQDLYRGTPVTRAKRRGLARNAAVALGNLGSDADVPILVETLAHHDEPLARGHAAWALARIGGMHAEDPLSRRLNIEPDDSVRAEVAAALDGSVTARR